MTERTCMIEARKRLDVDLVAMARVCRCSWRLLELLEQDTREVTVPGIAQRIADAYGLDAEQYELLLPVNRRPHSPEYDPDKYTDNGTYF